MQTAYAAEVAAGRIVADPAQREAVAELGRLESALSGRRRWRRAAPAGVYLHGPVGRGKTWLMDRFFGTLPTEAKLRRHFHAFMLEEVHAPLRRLRRQRDPLPRIARDIARRARVLCFDELFVEDIADAMLLGRLLEALFAEKVALVATANVPPEGLYRGGLKRERFLPAIAALERHCRVVAVGGSRDYRRERLGAAGAYRVTPDDGEARLAAVFRDLAGRPPQPGTVTLAGRPMNVAGSTEDMLFARFPQLCEGPRGAADYLALAERYRSLLLAGVPVMDDESPAPTRRFISLIDILYERNTLLVCTAGAEPQALYRGRRFRFEFRRTASRLEEMRSADYLAGTHLARAPALTGL